MGVHVQGVQGFLIHVQGGGLVHIQVTGSLVLDRRWGVLYEGRQAVLAALYTITGYGGPGYVLEWSLDRALMKALTAV